MKPSYRRSISFVLSIAALLAGLASEPLPAMAAGTITVGCGAGSQPSIGAAVALTPNAPASAGTIKVCPGTYAEQVLISNKNNLKLVGAGTATNAVVVTGPSPKTGAIIAVVNSTKVTIQGFVIEGPGFNTGTSSQGILFQNSSGTISKNTIRDIYDNAGGTAGLASMDAPAIDAVRVVGPTPGPVKILQNTIFRFQHRGIALAYVTGAKVTKNLVLTSGGVSYPIEILLIYSDGNTVSGNVLKRQISTGIVFGIQIHDARNNTISKNTISDTSIGITLSSNCISLAHPGTSGNKITGNKMYDSISATYWSALVTAGTVCSPTVTQNTLSGNKFYSHGSAPSTAVDAIHTAGGMFPGSLVNNAFIKNSMYGYGPLPSGLTSLGWNTTGNKIYFPAPPGP